MRSLDSQLRWCKMSLHSQGDRIEVQELECSAPPAGLDVAWQASVRMERGELGV
jgi:hypothetical protein